MRLIISLGKNIRNYLIKENQKPMPRTTEMEQPYFSHDLSSCEDKKIKKLIRDMGYEGYGLFWRIVEFMHRNELQVGEEDLIEKSETEKIKKILNDYNLFHKEDGYYISDRIQRNIERQKKKKTAAQKAVQSRWLFQTFNSVYEDVFGNKPQLSSDEVAKLREYAAQISNFKELLPDLIYSLSFVKFENTNFKPCANWLLKDNNLLRLLNGEFGKLKHRKTEEPEKSQENPSCEDTLIAEIKAVKTRLEALELIVKRTPNTAFIMPQLKKLMNKYNITTDEIKKRSEEKKMSKQNAPPE